MASAGYRVVDEPLPGARGSAVVNPTWPMFAMMLGGAWLAWPWFLFNAWAMGSPRLLRNAAWVAAGLAGSLAMAMGTMVVLALGLLPQSGVPYAMIALLIWKLLVTYALTLDQERSFELHQYFGGKVANGIWVMLIGSFYLNRRVNEAIDGVGSDMLRALLGWVLG